MNLTNVLNWGGYIVKKQSEAKLALGMLKQSFCATPSKIKLIAYKTLCKARM